MNIRKERMHQCGLTNLDFKTKGDSEMMSVYRDGPKNLNFGTMGRTAYKRTTSAANFKEQIATISGRKHPVVANPRTESTKQFYLDQNKKQRV